MGKEYGLNNSIAWFDTIRLSFERDGYIERDGYGGVRQGYPSPEQPNGEVVYVSMFQVINWQVRPF